MKLGKNDILKTFSPLKIAIAMSLGLLVTAYLFYDRIKDKNIDELLQALSSPRIEWLFLAIIVLLARDLGYIYRIRNLTNGELTWKGSVYTILLWEFASAVTPSVVGGTAVAVFFLNKEGIKFGKSLAYVMLTAILDNSFFIIAAPIVLILTQGDVFPNLPGTSISFQTLFIISYSLIALYTLVMAVSVLFIPHAFRRVLLTCVNIVYSVTAYPRVFAKLRIEIRNQFEDIILASKELKNKSLAYWAKAYVSTAFIWTARYFMLNCLLAAFSTSMDKEAHFMAFSKQIILWITQLISPTPGGSGFAEYFLEQIFGGGIIIIAVGLLWRILTFYAYLIAGSIVLPNWIKRVYLDEEKD